LTAVSLEEGIFISFEGIDGSGKSTQMERTAEFIRSRGYSVLATREPGGTELAERIRKVLLDAKMEGKVTSKAELLLYLASRHQHSKEIIEPFLDGGGVVLTDRYADSSTAYQGVGRGLGVELVEGLNELVIPRWPDLTVLIDIPAEIAILRTGGRDLDRLESEGVEFQERIRRGYIELAKRHPERICVVESREDKDETTAEVLRVIGTFFDKIERLYNG